MLERYLDDLRRDLAHRLPEPELQARLAEASEHLQDSIQARLELGSSPTEAEREAIEAFGSARVVAQAVLSAERGRAARGREAWLNGWWLFVALALVESTAAVRGTPDALVWLGTASVSVVAVGFGLAAFRSGAPAPHRALISALRAVALGVPLLLATHVTYFGEGYVELKPRWRVAQTCAELRSMARLARNGQVRDQTSPATDAALERRYLGYADELQQASERPLTNVVPALCVATPIVGVAVLPALLLDLAFGGLGCVAALPGRRKLRLG